MLLSGSFYPAADIWSFAISYADSNRGFLCLGALVVLLSIAADPFTQQLIQYQQQVVYTEDPNATVNRAGRFAKGSGIRTTSNVSSDGESNH